MNQEFHTLASEIDRRWRDKDFDTASFPTIATESLRAARLHEQIDPLAPAKDVIRALEIPPQQDLSATFGEPPITVFQNDRFFIDVYYWLDGTTLIHEHGFCGAFAVMEGSSIHTRFDFREQRHFNRRLSIGELTVKSCELLEVGDVCEIPAGADLVHSLFHLDRPSVSVVVRTSASWTAPQRHFLWPNVALASVSMPHQTRRRQCLEMLAKTDHEAFLIELQSALNRVPPDEFAFLVIALRIHLGKTKELARTLDRIDARHHELLEALVPAIIHQKRMLKLIDTRAKTSDPEERHLLALLLNARDNASFRKLATRRWPEDRLSEHLNEIFSRLFSRSTSPPFDLPTHSRLSEFCADILTGKETSIPSEEETEVVKSVRKNLVLRSFTDG
ncbi:MAG: hypothetical protein AAGA58_05950 [Verrucomicrobiota bacterium]